MLESREWTDAQIGVLVRNYSNVPIDWEALIAETGKSKFAIQIKASRLGLADMHRKVVAPESRKVREPKFKTKEERRASQSERQREYLKKNGHPRGALGMKHSASTRQLLSELSRKQWADRNSKFNSAEYRQLLSDKLHGQQATGEMRSCYSRSRGGRRADIGDMYFRSAWEANYARYLNFLVTQGEIKGWEYESKTFTFDRIKRGTRAYTPDFKVYRNDGGHEWHEVKGWMDAKSKTRLDRFARYYPEEKLVLVDAAWFNAANKTLPGLIANWEGARRHSRMPERGGGMVKVRLTPGPEAA